MKNKDDSTKLLNDNKDKGTKKLIASERATDAIEHLLIISECV